MERLEAKGGGALQTAASRTSVSDGVAAGLSRGRGRTWSARRDRFGTIFHAAEDHFAGGSLVCGSHEDIDGAIDEAPGAIDDDHVPSSRYATPCVASLPSRRISTRMDSPGSTAGFMALASSLTLSTE